ncbi:MAG: thermonuclease family protein [Candidatus Electrothrix sp. YB6]
MQTPFQTLFSRRNPFPGITCLASGTVLFLLLNLPAGVAAKKERSYGNLKDVQFIKNYDGDTITVDLKGHHPLFGDNISVRVAGIDTPEIRGKCAQEKELAREAKQVVGQILQDARRIRLNNVRRGKYFRIVADVKADRQDIAELLIDEGLAVPYDGGKKTYDWCRGKTGKRRSARRQTKEKKEKGWLDLFKVLVE